MMTISKMRRALYKSARVLGDVNAVKRGRVPQRIVNRGLARLAFKALRKFWL